MITEMILPVITITILLWITAATAHAMPFQCPDTIPGIISTQPQLPLTRIRVIEGESFTFSCARACGSEAKWSMRIPKYKQAVYFPQRKHSSSELPHHMTATLQDNTKCVQCPVNFPTHREMFQIVFYTLQLDNIHKDVNESKIYCGQVISSGTSLVEEPITLMVYSPDKQFDKQFPLPRRATKSKIKIARKFTGYKFIDKLLYKLKRGDVTMQIAVYLLVMVFNLIFSIFLTLIISIMSDQIDPTAVTFIGKVYTTTISDYEKTVKWPEAGLELHIPEDVLPIGQESVFRCRQAIAGPFVVPPGQTLASTIYHITVSPPLQGDIELTITHAAKLRSFDDCASMQFLRASDFPVENENGEVEYHFHEVNGGLGTFTAHSRKAKIRLRRFSFWCCSTSKSKTVDYLVKLACPQEPLRPTPHAIYAVSLATPTLDKFFNDLLRSLYPMEQFKSTDGRQVTFKCDSDYAELHTPKSVEDQKYRVLVKSGTEKITKKMADLPARNEEYKQYYSPMYPPRAELEFSILDNENPPPKPLECKFNVTVNTETSVDGISFAVSLPQILPQQPVAAVTANGTLTAIHTTGSAVNLFEMVPAMKDLQLIKWHDIDGQTRELNIIERGSNKWIEIGDQFEIDKSVLREFEDGWRYNSARFRCVLQKWLETGGTCSYKCTWNGLIDVLRDVKHSTLADDIKLALTSMEQANPLYKKTV